MNKQQLIDKGFDVSHWRQSSDYDMAEDAIFGDIVGVVYDTSRWPVPGDTYHPDNWPFWHNCDPNRPESKEADADFERRLKDMKSLGGCPRHEAILAYEQNLKRKSESAPSCA